MPRYDNPNLIKVMRDIQHEKVNSRELLFKILMHWMSDEQIQTLVESVGYRDLLRERARENVCVCGNPDCKEKEDK